MHSLSLFANFKVSMFDCFILDWNYFNFTKNKTQEIHKYENYLQFITN